ncbi:hypothetical protein ACQ86D_01225 [Streptomyces galilaeus]
MSVRDEVLTHVRRHGSASRPELQTALGLSRPVVAAVVRDLLAEELLTEHQGENKGAVGAPADAFGRATRRARSSESTSATGISPSPRPPWTSPSGPSTGWRSMWTPDRPQHSTSRPT